MRTDNGTSGNPPVTFGQEAPMGFAGLTQGLALIGPSASRRRVLRSLIVDALASGTGVVALSIGRDGALLDAAQALAEQAGRSAETLIVDTEGGPGRSHALAPFHDLDADALTSVMLACMPTHAGLGTAAPRARHLLTCVMQALVGLRDQGLLHLGATAIVDHLNLRRLIDLSSQDHYPEMPEPARKAVRGYLDSLPGYVEHKRYIQPAAAFESHSEAATLVTDAIGWAMRTQFAPLAAVHEADATLSDLFVPGHLAFLRCLAVPGEENVPSFVTGCLTGILARRTDDAPTILIVDGADALPRWQLQDLCLTRTPGLAVVVGLNGGREISGTAVRELAWKAVLPGAGAKALSVLDLAEDGLRDLKDLSTHDKAILGHGGIARAVALPESVSDPVRGKVQPRTKPVGNPTGGEAWDTTGITIALDRIFEKWDLCEEPVLNDTLSDAGRAFEIAGTTSEAGGLAVAMAMRRVGGEG